MDKNRITVDILDISYVSRTSFNDKGNKYILVSFWRNEVWIAMIQLGFFKC